MTICWEREGYAPQEITVPVCNAHRTAVVAATRDALLDSSHA